MGNILALGTFQGLAAGVEQKKAKIKKSIKNRHLPPQNNAGDNADNE